MLPFVVCMHLYLFVVAFMCFDCWFVSVCLLCFVFVLLLLLLLLMYNCACCCTCLYVVVIVCICLFSFLCVVLYLFRLLANRGNSSFCNTFCKIKDIIWFQDPRIRHLVNFGMLFSGPFLTRFYCLFVSCDLVFHDRATFCAQSVGKRLSILKRLFVSKFRSRFMRIVAVRLLNRLVVDSTLERPPSSGC